MPPRAAASSTTAYSADLSIGSVRLSDLSHIDVGKKIPGFRTSAAFFASLKANLRLTENSTTPLPSPSPTPLGFRNINTKNRNPCAAVGLKSSSDNGLLCPPSPLLLGNGTVLHDAKHLTSALKPLNQSGLATTKGLSSPHGRSTSKPVSNLKLADNNPATTADEDDDDAQSEDASRPRLYWTTSQQDADQALALLASTVAEQKHLALRSLLTHPLNVVLFVATLFILQKSMFCVARYTSYRNRSIHGASSLGSSSSDRDNASWAAVALVWTAVALTLLLMAHVFTWPYARLSRGIAASTSSASAATADDNAKGGGCDAWFKPGRDEVLVAIAGGDQSAHAHARAEDANGMHGTCSTIKTVASSSLSTTSTSPQQQQQKQQRLQRSEHPQTDTHEQEEHIIGVLIMHWAPCVAGPKVNKRRRSSGGRSYVKAWATSPAWRGSGIGAELLAEAVRVTFKERGGDSASFAERHAHAERVLPDFYNGAFDRRDRRAKLALLHTITARPWMSNRRR